MVEIYTNGDCPGNPGPGGWGVFLRSHAVEKKLFGGEFHTTNNRMELTAAIKGLQVLEHPSQVRLMTDSEYVQRGITEWLVGWKRRDWCLKNYNPVKNVDLWQILDQEASRHEISWIWVCRYSGYEGNDIAYELATQGIHETCKKYWIDKKSA